HQFLRSEVQRRGDSTAILLDEQRVVTDVQSEIETVVGGGTHSAESSGDDRVHVAHVGQVVEGEASPRASREVQRGWHEGQVPLSSRTWRTSTYPNCLARACAQRSSSGASTSTVAPHVRHARWWWCESSTQRR